MKLEIGSDTKPKNTFELVLNVKDKEGRPTGKKKSYVTEDPMRLHRFFVRNSGMVKKKRKKTEAAKSRTEVQTALKEVEQHTNKIRQKRKLED